VSARENLSPGFSISHSAPEVFPERERFREFGYEPFDVFLTDEVSEDAIRDPRMFIEGEGAEEFFDGFQDDYMLVFRYKREDFDPESMAGAPDSVRTAPAFKAETYPASLQPDQDTLALERFLENSAEPVSDAFYIQALDLKDGERISRPKSPGYYLGVVSGAEITMAPETFGLSEVGLQPDNMEATVVLYQDEVKVPTSRRPEFKNYDLGDTGSDAYETMDIERDEEEIELVEDELRSIGFDVSRAYLSDTASPHDF
jgi:hypothetical protein